MSHIYEHKKDVINFALAEFFWAFSIHTFKFNNSMYLREMKQSPQENKILSLWVHSGFYILYSCLSSPSTFPSFISSCLPQKMGSWFPGRHFHLTEWTSINLWAKDSFVYKHIMSSADTKCKQTSYALPVTDAARIQLFLYEC